MIKNYSVNKKKIFDLIDRNDNLKIISFSDILPCL